jgi:hypothetical protein
MLRGSPHMLTPIWGDQAYSQGLADHPAMAIIQAKRMVQAAEDTKIRISVTRTFAGCNMVDMTRVKAEDMGDSKLTTAHTLAAIAKPDASTGHGPLFSGLASEWHGRSYAVLGRAQLHSAALSRARLNWALPRSARLSSARLGLARRSFASLGWVVMRTCMRANNLCWASLRLASPCSARHSSAMLRYAMLRSVMLCWVVSLFPGAGMTYA